MAQSYKKIRFLFVVFASITLSSFFVLQITLEESLVENETIRSNKRFEIQKITVIKRSIYVKNVCLKVSHLFPLFNNIAIHRTSLKRREEKIRSLKKHGINGFSETLANRIQLQLNISNNIKFYHQSRNKLIEEQTERNEENKDFHCHFRTNISQKHSDQAASKLILLYYYDKTLNNKIYVDQKCAINNCKITRKSEDFQQADVVIFKAIPSNIKRPLTKPNQLWIYLQLESPFHTRPIPHDTKINLTSTYRTDSILPTPYGLYHSKWKGKDFVPKRKMFHLKPFQKTKLVAWFVSNCNDKNGRLEYARKLQNYITIDIYGACGNLTCKRDDAETCLKMLQKEYKFYLAFENSNCIDYITEKFFNALRYDVVPVVMGGRIEDYKQIAPPNSFIHVDEFSGPQELSKYLLELNENMDLYLKYFDWKNKGGFVEDLKFQCRLCSVIQISDSFQFWYNDLNAWWTNGTCVGPPLKDSWSSWKTDNTTDFRLVSQIMD